MIGIGNLVDLTGHIFGRLTVLKRADDYIQPSGRRRPAWLCRCECGNEIIALGDNLSCGRTNSCGCLRKEMMAEKQVTHGKTDTRLYAIWQQMKNRCCNKNLKAYKDYGGRGISVCDEWMHDFNTFYTWSIQHGYTDDLSIDRIDNDGNYTPNNCRWVTGAAQANNRRTNRLYTLDGETMSLTEWAHSRGVDPRKVFNRVYAGWDFQTALSTP